jgi:hypothetical protein
VIKEHVFPLAIHAEANTEQEMFLVQATEPEKAYMKQGLGWTLDWEPLMGEEIQ